MRTQIINQTYDEERALYHLEHTDVIGCTFAGPADGESALKEARDVTVRDCRFSLRYPLWHTLRFTLEESHLDELTRAPSGMRRREGLSTPSSTALNACVSAVALPCAAVPLTHPNLAGAAGRLASTTVRSQANIFSLRRRAVKLTGCGWRGNILFNTRKACTSGIRRFIPRMRSGTAKMSQSRTARCAVSISAGIRRI